MYVTRRILWIMDKVSETKTQRISITVPSRVLELLKYNAAARNVSRFFTEAEEEKIAREEKAKALEVLLNAPPTHTKIADAVEYLKSIREEDDQQAKRFGE